MPSYNASSLVLHRSDLGENDRLLTLFTREKGKLNAVAKGARRGVSRLSGATELFVLAKLQLAVGRSLDIVMQCEIEKSFTALRMDLQKLARATYFCELLDRFTGDRDAVSSPELFDLTVAALLLLERASEYPDAVVHAYELQLLSALGYAPVLDRCVACGNLVSGQGIGFSPALGGLICTQDRSRVDDAVGVSRESVQMLRVLESGEPAEVLRLAPAAASAAEMAKALGRFVRSRSDRNLKSADFLDQIRAAG
jgi:DNA repair protein RecO (recombination protein O)